MSNIIIRAPVFQKEAVKVSDEGESVVLTIGNSELRFPYEDALTIAALVRLHAKRAKARAGDYSRNWRTLGILDGIKQ